MDSNISHEGIRLSISRKKTMFKSLKLTHIAKLPKNKDIFWHKFGYLDKKSSKYFLKNVPKFDMNNFFFHIKYGESWMKIKDFIFDLSKIIPKVSKEFSFSNFKFSRRDFQHVMNSSFGWERITFCDCVLLFDEGIFISNRYESTIKHLDFGGCGKPRKSDWMGNPSRFDNIVEAISQSRIKESLQTIRIVDCYVNIDSVKSTLVYFGMENVYVY